MPFDYAQIDGGINPKRTINTAGTAHAPGDYALSAGFGSTAAVTLGAGTNDMGGRVTITCGGTGQGASPTLPRTPTLVFTFNGTASGTEVYSFVWRL